MPDLKAASIIGKNVLSVDEVLVRAELHGGVISKPPNNKLWGYSAYVTDPSGYLWKVASSKRRPLIARKEPSADNGRVVELRTDSDRHSPIAVD
jgi:hypothetical protein